MLETVRALRTGDRLRNDLVLLITDGEERGLLGAAAFARRRPPLGAHPVVLNRDARGVSGPSLVELYRLLPNDTDFTELAGAPPVG